MMLNNTCKGQKGLTLVEVLVTSILSTIGAGIILASFYMTVRETRESSSNLSMERVHDVVMADIALKVRNSDAVLADGASYATRNTTAADSGVVKINIYDNSSTPVAGYEIINNVLHELVNGSMTAFQVEGESVTLQAGSSFIVHGGGRGVTVNLALKQTVDGNVYSLAARGESIQCRKVL